MNHPHEGRLLLLAYGELPEAEAAELETHVSACAVCRDDLERLERARVALDWTVPNERRPVRWIAAGLAAAAVLALVPALAPIDSLLTRLEQEKPYAVP